MHSVLCLDDRRTGMRTNLRACDDQPNQSAIIRSQALHALVQTLSKVRMWIFDVVHCSRRNKTFFVKKRTFMKLKKQKDNKVKKSSNSNKL